MGLRRKKRYTIEKDDLDGLEIVALLLDEEANQLDKHGAAETEASDITKMTVGNERATDVIRGFAHWLRTLAQRIRR